MSLKHLIYISAAITEFDGDQLDAILESSVRHNQPVGVTGMLLYSNGSFMQVLEGAAAAVDEVYSRILADTRHHDIFLIADDPIGQRNFGQWSMGFRRLSNADLTRHPAYAPLVANGFDAAALGVRPGEVLEILKDFSRR